MSSVQSTLAISQGASPAFCDPCIKFPGSKRWLVGLLVPRLHAHLTKVQGVYVEPFAGSLAIGLALGWPDSVYADKCPDIANLHTAVRDTPVEVSWALDGLRDRTGEATYYAIRESIWPENRKDLPKAVVAARTIYLSKNCFNGLFRYSQKGKFNASWGKRLNVALPSAEHIAQVSRALQGSTIAEADFESVLAQATAVDPKRLVIFLDPPYSGTLKNKDDEGGSTQESFTGYTGKFTWKEQVRLVELARGLARRGACVIATNTWSEEVCDLWRDGFELFQVGVQHCIGATGDRRGKRAEMIAITEAHAGLLDAVPARRK